jgi:hypothetical protein
MQPFPQMPSGFFWGKLDNKQREQCLEECADELADRVEIYMDTIMDAVGLAHALPAERLNRYVTKTPEEWEEQAATFPRDYEEDMEDFRKLSEKSAAG